MSHTGVTLVGQENSKQNPIDLLCSQTAVECSPTGSATVKSRIQVYQAYLLRSDKEAVFSRRMSLHTYKKHT